MRKRNTASLDRRSFLAAAMSAALAGKILAEQSSKIYTAAIIGHTGHGDYGHSVDQIFTNRADVQLLAVADPLAEGRAKAMQRSKALRQYENYREMLAKDMRGAEETTKENMRKVGGESPSDRMADLGDDSPFPLTQRDDSWFALFRPGFEGQPVVDWNNHHAERCSCVVAHLRE